MSWLQANSGKKIDLINPEKSEWDIDDVAHGLAHACRWNGQIVQFYSVAQHSVLVSEQVPEEDAFAALMHDASEAFIADIPRPAKALIPGYYELEAKLMNAMSDHFGFVYPMPESVHIADNRMLVTEDKLLRNNLVETVVKDYWKGITPYKIKIKSLDPLQAKLMFLSRFQALTYKKVA